jgi:hypothetical protein
MDNNFGHNTTLKFTANFFKQKKAPAKIARALKA